MTAAVAVSVGVPIAHRDSADSAIGQPMALYIHVPFCMSICPYCDFVVVAGRAARGPAN